MHYTYTLLICTSNGEQISGTVSSRALKQTRTFARAILRLTPQAAFVDIYTFSPSSATLPAQALEQVNWDQDWEH